MLHCCIKRGAYHVYGWIYSSWNWNKFTSLWSKTVQSTKINEIKIVCLILKSKIISGDNQWVRKYMWALFLIQGLHLIMFGETRALLVNFKKSCYSYDVLYFPDVGNNCIIVIIVVVVSSFIHGITSLKSSSSEPFT